MYTILAAQSSPLSYLKLPALMSPDLGLLRNVHPRISSPEVRQKHRKEFTPLRYRELGEYHGCHPRVSAVRWGWGMPFGTTGGRAIYCTN